MRFGDNSPESVPSKSSRVDSQVIQALHHFGAMGRNSPENAWELFNRECPYWLTAVFGEAAHGHDRAFGASAHMEHGIAHPAPGGHEVSGVWIRGKGHMTGGDWTVVRA